MSKVALLMTLSFLGFPNVGLAQNCALSGTPSWSKQLVNVIADCDNRFASPDGKLLLSIDAEGNIHVSVVASGSEIRIDSRVVKPPAMASWSPTSRAFFINDGEGSGMSSTFRLFREMDNRIVEDETVQREAVVFYRRQAKCSAASADPNVWGIGWSPDGSRFYLLVQASVNSPCGEPGSFIGLTVKLADGSVLKEFPEGVTKHKFQSLLPPEIYSK
jgi:hypothetical protein